jgi:hypothetical protein
MYCNFYASTSYVSPQYLLLCTMVEQIIVLQPSAFIVSGFIFATNWFAGFEVIIAMTMKSTASFGE